MSAANDTSYNGTNESDSSSDDETLSRQNTPYDESNPDFFLNSHVQNTKKITQKENDSVPKPVVSVHKNRAQVCSNKQALSEIASGMKLLTESQIKRYKLTLEEDQRREDRERQF